MDAEVRRLIQQATQNARQLLEGEIGAQLEGTFGILPDGTVPARPGGHLDPSEKVTFEKLVAAINHFRPEGGQNPEGAVARYVREAAFTTLNRFVALKMLEARGIVQQCVSMGPESSGFREFTGMAPALAELPDQGYQLYIESLFDEIGREVGVLFDRRDPSSLVWPRRPALLELLAILNQEDLDGLWEADETIGWVYQFFNSEDERREMRKASSAPQNSRELAVLNQFFTPRYVVEFLTDNTLGRLWFEMMGGDSRLGGLDYLVKGEVSPRVKKDPREIAILDPAVGSGHFLLYAFDLMTKIYEETWHDPDAARFPATDKTLREDFPSLDELQRQIPGLILRHNLHGVDIDPRAAQIAALALWLRAQRALDDLGVPRDERPAIHRTNIVIAEPIPADKRLVEDFARAFQVPVLSQLFEKIVDEIALAGEMGSLLRVERAIEKELQDTKAQYLELRGPKTPIGIHEDLLPTGESELDLKNIHGVQFFEEAIPQLLEGLANFAASASGADWVSRRMFSDDAAQGVAFVELMHKRFDVILMNPPFGAGSKKAKEVFDKAYPRTRRDVYAAFVKRGIELLHPRGLLGAITSRTGFFLSSFQKWREEILLREAPPIVFADLGYGVLDGAMVEVAAYCLEKVS